MALSISVYSLQEVARVLDSLRSASERLLGFAVGSLKQAAVRSGGLMKQESAVGRDKVELLFWVHKAFIVGFVAALALAGLRA